MSETTVPTARLDLRPLIMWVPMSLAYLVAAVFLTLLLLSPENRDSPAALTPYR